MKLDDMIFRCWYYFQLGWKVYFTIIFAIINVITLLYSFVLTDYTFLKDIFNNYTSFALFVMVIILILCTSLGFKHIYSRARRSEIDIIYEVNPYLTRKTVNTEIILTNYLLLVKLFLKNISNSNSIYIDSHNIKNYIYETKNFLNSRTLTNKSDLNLLKKIKKI